MRKTALLFVVAAGIGIAAWVAGTRGQTVLGTGETSSSTEKAERAPTGAVQAAAAMEKDWAQQAAAPDPTSEAEPQAEASPEQTYSIQASLLPALETYRKADDVAERESSLLDLALSDDPGVLPFLMDELHHSSPVNRQQVVDAVVQYGDRKAIPELRKMARDAKTFQEQKDLTEAADYLALPSFTEMRSGKWKLGDPPPTE